jgi:hypothetical protein
VSVTNFQDGGAAWPTALIAAAATCRRLRTTYQLVEHEYECYRGVQYATDVVWLSKIAFFTDS